MNIYLLTDGMCENPLDKTSLLMSSHPNLDILTSYGKMGFYEPVIRDYIHNPETFIIFPFFFGLHPMNNPGRAGLELFELGNDISNLQSFCIIRVVHKEYNIFKVLNNDSIDSTWTKAPKLVNTQEIQQLIDDVESFLKTVKIIKSPRRDNVWSIGAISKADLEDAINLIQFKLNSLDYNVYAMLMNDFKYIPYHPQSMKSMTFLGWGFSTLIEAFRFAGINIHQSFSDIKNHLFDYEKKHKDFDENILPYLIASKESDETCILFFKEPSRAAREYTTPDLKIQSIGFIDEIVGKLLNAFVGDSVNIIVLSDHQSNIGSKRTYPGQTMYYYGNLAREHSKKALFNEICATNEVLEQQDLIKKINEYIN